MFLTHHPNTRLEFFSDFYDKFLNGLLTAAWLCHCYFHNHIFHNFGRSRQFVVKLAIKGTETGICKFVMQFVEII